MESINIRDSTNIKIDTGLCNVTIINSKNITITQFAKDIKNLEKKKPVILSNFHKNRITRFGSNNKTNIKLDEKLPFRRPKTFKNNENVGYKKYLDEDIENYKNNIYPTKNNNYKSQPQLFDSYSKFLDGRIDQHKKKREQEHLDISETLYISHLHHRTNEVDLNDIFSEFELENIKICTDNSAFITFKDKQSAQNALTAYNGKELDLIFISLKLFQWPNKMITNIFIRVLRIKNKISIT